GVRVGQSRHQHPPAQVDRASTVRAPLPVVRDAADDTVFDQDRGVLAQRRPGAVEKPRSGQPEPPLLRGRSRDQCREPMRHVVTTLSCLLTRYPQTVVTHPAPRLPRWPAPAQVTRRAGAGSASATLAPPVPEPDGMDAARPGTPCRLAACPGRD